MANPKFLYRLQKVLDLRIRKADQLKLELASATRLRDAEVVKLNQLVERRQKAQKALETQLAEGAVAEVQMTNDFIQAVNAKVEAQNKAVARANKNVEELRKKLLEASKERQIMDKHKEKKREEWLLEQKRIEAKNTDEMAGNIYHAGRRKLNGSLEEEARYADVQQKLQLLKMLREKRK